MTDEMLKKNSTNPDEMPKKNLTNPDEMPKKNLTNPDKQKVIYVTIPTVIVTAIITASVSIATAYFAYRQNISQIEAQVRARDSQVQELQQGTNKLQASSLGSLEKGQKLCRVLQGKTWRDGLIVPQNWSVNLCIDYMKKTGGNGYQLGCIYADGTNLGREDGSFPSPNCGWQ